jgi:hypothetical protein
MTGKPYRLLSEPSLSTRRAPGRRRPIRGEEVGETNAKCFNCGRRRDNKRPSLVGPFAANRFGPP